MAMKSTYNVETAEKICELIADGMALHKIAAIKGMPSPACVRRWLAANTDFLIMYAAAREEQADALADQVLTIADEPPERITRVSDDGGTSYESIDPAAVNNKRVRIDARKWIAAKLRPRKYGDSSSIDHVIKADSSLVALLDAARKRVADDENGS